jgi:hypothetical protein
MPSQLDLDQGGTFREWTKLYLGPSVGWTYVPGNVLFPITVAGTYTLLVGTSVVTVNVAGAVTIILPTAIAPSVPAGVLPGRFSYTPITIIDVGGNAAAYPITIQPASGGEDIMGLASITISNNYGSFTLDPIKGWTTL